MRTHESRFRSDRWAKAVMAGGLACLLLLALSAPSLAARQGPAAPSPRANPQITPLPTLLIVTVSPLQPAETPSATTDAGGGRQNRQGGPSQGNAASLVQQADDLALQSRFPEAETLYADAVRRDPRNPAAYAHWARALLWDLRTEDALAKSLLATQIDPGNAEAFIYLARARDWLGESEAALAAAQQAVTLAPDLADAHAILAEVYLDADRPDRAHESIDRAMQLEPENPEALRSQAYLLAAEGNLDEAIKHSERAAQLQPGLWLRYDDLATTLRLIGDYEQAGRFYQWAIDLWPKAVSYAGLGLCQIELSLNEEAVASFTRAIELDANNAAAHGGLALALARLGECDRSAEAAQAALALDPGNSGAQEANDTCSGSAPAEPAAPTRRSAPVEAPTPRVFRVAETPAPPAPAPVTQPQPALSGRLLYSVFDPSRATYDLYLASLDGSGRGRLLADAGAGDLSPDGRQIAFRSWDPANRGIYAQTIGGNDRRVLTSQFFNEDTLPRWSPAGDLIIFSSRRESDRRSRLYFANPAGKDDTVVRMGVESAYGEHPGWLPDGRIAFSGCAGNNCGLLLMGGSGGAATQLTDHPSDTAPSASPDGSAVAFMSSRDGNWEVYVVSAAGGSPVRLTTDGANDGLPEWSPDGRSIAFASSRGGRWGIWVMNADGTNQRLLIEPEGPLDGRVRQEPDFASRGWIDENISWAP